MTYARALRWTAGAAMVTATLLIAAPAHAGPAHRARALAPSYAQDAGGDAAGEVFEELAGSAAGAGRERPGLPATEPPNPEAVLVSRPVPVRPRPEPARPVLPTPSATALVGALGTEPNERAADLAAHMLPLGTGFALMGTGLGFMGMRLRRGR
ncbi:hypothetical protein ACFWCB_18590 [Streptomyces sp. NPDC060048]|uniref:hypothetical protein n=1 Tax=unclassified Streptomyces TaxID=2593676 RepID=UPI0036C9CD95